MTFDEALSAAIEGERVRADDMQPGSYVDYHFNGWRRNFAGGASSGFTPTELDRAANWSIFEPEPKRDAWGRFPVPNSVVVTHNPSNERSWDSVMSDKERVEGGWRDKPARNKWGQPQ
jgi:hypothetical protein